MKKANLCSGSGPVEQETHRLQPASLQIPKFI